MPVNYPQEYNLDFELLRNLSSISLQNIMLVNIKIILTTIPFNL
jgi:hypothetical protein